MRTLQCELEEARRRLQVEAALEQVRARTMAMQNSEELSDTIGVLFEQFDRLGVRPVSTFLVLFDLEGDRFSFRMTGKEGNRIPAEVMMSMDDMPQFRPVRDAWESGQNLFESTYPAEFLDDWFSIIDPLLAHLPEEARLSREDFPDGLYNCSGRHTYGTLGITQSHPASTEQKQLVVRFAREFEPVYQRFRDLQRAETDYTLLLEEKARTEAALAELNATQKQLVEQEKLASLGSLTAGIAHEIKNPLNFVNNFAEVNAELADELAEAVKAGAMEEFESILTDLRDNARQIAKHGKRADSIVRAMMQHARGGQSEPETVDFNTFVDEYVGLAWHGMRARDHGFQADVVKNLDPAIGSVSLQPQEFGRVLVNLLNNAFQAVTAADVENAEITVSTEATAGGIRLTIADNGPGIPLEIREKIFEPFFTTKATGEGTGLGLSLSYDIITKGHNGTMSVRNAPEGGACFIIEIPGGAR